MAFDPKTAALALHRFGFGPRPGSIAAVASDPRGALLAELDRADAGQIATTDLLTSGGAVRAVFEWNLWQILFHRPETATLKLPGAAVEIERFADGRIDLYETVKPIIREHPDHRLVIVIEGGRVVIEGTSGALRANEVIRQSYLGLSASGARASFRRTAAAALSPAGSLDYISLGEAKKKPAL